MTMKMTDLDEVVNFLKLGINRSTLSQVILPFNSNSNESENIPVALLSGNVNFKTSFKKDGKLIPFEEELEKLEKELYEMKTSKLKNKVSTSEVINLLEEMKKLSFEAIDGNEIILDEKEVEIKEKWTEEDEIILRSRTLNNRKTIIPLHNIKIETETKIEINDQSSNKKAQIPEDINELLLLAELEEDAEGKDVDVRNGMHSKMSVIKNELKEEKSKIYGRATEKGFSNLNLPKVDAKNAFVGVVGEIVEHVPEVPVRNNQNECISACKGIIPDKVSSRIIINELKSKNLKSSEESHEIDDQVQRDPIKKSSRFSLRKRNM